MGFWNIEEITGYKPKTTFWLDFSIAEAFGESVIQDTFESAFRDWKHNYVYLTELVMVLNWKIFAWYEKDVKKSMLYQKLWEKADAWACENLKDDELSYFYQTTD